MKIMQPAQEVTYLLGSKTSPSITADQQSDEYSVAKSPFHALQVINPSGATVTVQVSLDGDNWVDLVAPITATTYYGVFYGFYKWVRASRDNSTDQVTVLWGNRSYTHQ